MIKIFLLFLALVSFKFSNSHVKDTIIQSILSEELNTINSPDSAYKFNWNDSLGVWSKNLRHTYMYDSQGRVSIEVKSHWDFDNWQMTNKLDYAFDNSLLIEVLNSKWDSFYLLWEKDNRYSYTYNNFNKVEHFLFSIWFSTNSIWKNDSLITNEYDAANNISYTYKYKWSIIADEWENNCKTHYIYDSTGNINSIEYSIWEFDLLLWQKERIQNFTYNEKNELIEKNQVLQNKFLTGWDKDWKIEYTYYSSGLLKEEIYYKWLINENDWVADYKFFYTYDDRLFINEKIGYTYDWDVLVWENHFKTQNVYNHNNTTLTTTHYSWKGNNWSPIEKQVFYYPGYNSITNDLSLENNKVYPNPANSNLFIDFSTEIFSEVNVMIYNLIGVEQFINKYYVTNSTLEIHLPYIPDGIYILSLTYKDKVASERILIQH